MENICSICRDNLFSVNTDVCVTQCDHMFHKTCLENWMNTSPTCPNCKTGITGTIRKTFLDVDDGLVYNGTSYETESFLEEIYDCDKDKRRTTLKIIKRLDKENTKLKQTNTTNLKNLEAFKVFIKGFKTENEDYQGKCQKLQTENGILIAELKKLNSSTEQNNVSEESHLEHRKQIKNIYSIDSWSKIKTILNKGLLSYFCLICLVFSIVL